MSAKATAIAPSNIAFIKYWGARDLARAVPCNPSISMTLRRCFTRCTVEYRDRPGADEVLFRSDTGELAPPGEAFTRRVRAHLDVLRELAGGPGSFRVATENSFPSAAGLASSASGFAALTLAAVRALGADLSGRELSDLARRSGSGSAARSVLGGFVEWPRDPRGERCPAEVLLEAGAWDLRDVVALVDVGPKDVSSLEGHRRAATSPYFEVRQQRLPARLRAVREALAARDLERLGPVVEEEAIDLHLIAMSSRPAIFYWRPATLRVLETVRGLRADGVPAFATMDAGPNVHVICAPDGAPEVARRLARVRGVDSVIEDGVGPGPRYVSEHLI